MRILCAVLLGCLLACTRSGASADGGGGAGSSDASTPDVDSGVDAGADSGIDPAPLDVPPADAGQFIFLSQTDATALAMQGSLAAFASAPTDQASLTKWQLDSTAARAAIRSNADAVVARAQAEVAAHRNSPADLMALYFLIAEAGTVSGATFLSAEAARAVPDNVSDGGTTEEGEGPGDLPRLARLAALGQLQRAASEDARAKLILLQLVSAASAEVRPRVVQSYLAISPQRWKAKRELLAKLKPDERHLVFANE